MADISYTSKATERRASPGVVPGKGDAHSVKALVVATIELAASASGATVKLGRIPSNARILGVGRIYNDDLATSGSPTLDIGLASVDSNVTSDPDAINNGIALSAATTTREVLADAANVGLPAWDLIAGLSADPGGELDVYATVKDAATNAAGTLSVEIYGYFD